MRLAYSSNAYQNFSIEETIARIAGLGYAGMELLADVPHAWPEDPYLAAWVRSQRHLRKQGRLAPDRFQRLDRLGFEWEPLATAWDDMFLTLAQFKERAGDCDVPHDLPYDQQLANWVIRQRLLRRQGRLAADRIERLDALGFKWSVLKTRTAPLDEMFARLAQFKDRHGHCKVLR